jgi:hypothetical protein
MISESLEDQPSTTSKSPLPKNVEVKAKLNQSEKEQEILKYIGEFCTEINEITLKEIFEQLTKNPDDWTTRRKKLLDKLESLGLNRPQFTIINGSRFTELSDEINFDQSTKVTDYKDEDLILIYRPPKPLDQFWKKGSGDWVEQELEVEEQIINWGKIYQTTTEQIWGLMDIYYASRGLKLARINPIGIHEPLKYYYIWKVSMDDNPEYDPQSD